MTSPGAVPSLKFAFPPSRPFTALLLLGLALSLFFWTVIGKDYQRGKYLELHPCPDAVEYFAMARAMARGMPPQLEIAGEKLPSRYPPGFAVCQLPWIFSLKEADAILAPLRTNQTLGILLLCGIFVWFWREGKPLAGGFSALLLATLPGFITNSRSPMADLCGATFVVFAFLALYSGWKHRQARWMYLAAVGLGLAFNVRYQLILFAPTLALAVFLDSGGNWRRWWLHCVAVLLVFLACASPALVLNQWQFGNPFTTGYSFWIPDMTATGTTFAAHYLPESLALLGREFAQFPDRYRFAQLYGTGIHFTPAFVLLALCGMARRHPWPVILCLGGGLLTFLLPTLFYFYQDSRIYLPLFLLATVPAGLAAEQAVNRWIAGQQRFRSLLVFLLVVGAVAGFPSMAGFPQRRWQMQLPYALGIIPHRDDRMSPASYRAAIEFQKRFGSSPGVVLSRINPVYLNAILPTDFMAAPIDGRHEYNHSRLWKYDAGSAQTLALFNLEKRRPVYALLTSEDGVETLPAISGWHWNRLPSDSQRAVILRLEPAIAPRF